MGRIDNALRRAAAEKGLEPSVPSPSREELDAPFVSAWPTEKAPAPTPSRRVVPSEGFAKDASGVGQVSANSGGRLAAPERAQSHSSSPSSSPTVRLEVQLARGWPQPFAPEVAGKLVIMPEVDSVTAGQYSRLAAALHQARSERGVKVIMVTSAVAAEGKTLTAVNLALTLTRSYGRVLLVDGNVTDPRLHQLFQVTAGAGLHSCLMSPAEREIPVVGVSETLSLLPVGQRMSDATLLGSDRMRAILAEASKRFEWVIVDSAPVLTTPDANPLATVVDGVVLVVEADKTSTRLAAQAVDVVGRERVLGVVLNRVRRSVAASAAESLAGVGDAVSADPRTRLIFPAT